MATGILRACRPLDHPPAYTVRLCGHDWDIRKEPDLNSQQRRQWYRAGRESQRMRSRIRTLCSQPCVESFLLWANLFAYTHRPYLIDADGRQRAVRDGATDIPFITWPCQDDVARDLIEGIFDGHDVAGDKSRDMGLTWLVLTVFHWCWQFFPKMHFLEMSRVEELVDAAEDPDTLMWKHDFLLRKQPGFLRPPVYRARLKLVNQVNGSTIIGRSTTSKQGRAGRKTAALLDEMAFIDEAEAIWRSLSQTTHCRIGVSTPNGPVYFEKLVHGRAGKIRVVRLPWWDHPEKGRGRYEGEHEQTGLPWIRSPWYDRESERMSMRDRAHELDIEHFGAGQTFFDGPVIIVHRRQHAREPLWRGDLRLHAEHRKTAIRRIRQGHTRAEGLAALEFRESPRGSWSIWCDLVEDETGLWRPDQRRTPVIGIDISHGQGASNSVMSVGWAETGEKIAEYASSTVSPHQLAYAAWIAGYWFGGRVGFAFVCPEANGPGGIFLKHLRRASYPWILAERNEKAKDQKTAVRYGWHSTEQSRIDLLGDYRAALDAGNIRNPSEQALDEAMSYVYLDGGGVGPSSFVDMETGAKRTHGDRVIADALLSQGFLWCSKVRPQSVEPAQGSARYRRKHPEVMQRSRLA